MFGRKSDGSRSIAEQIGAYYHVVVQTISLKLPDDLLAQLTSEAKARRVTRSRLVRESLEKALNERPSAGSVSCYDLARGSRRIGERASQGSGHQSQVHGRLRQVKRGPGLLDTGPLVSFLGSGLEHHSWTRDQWKRLSPPLLTCEPILTEAAFLRRREGRDSDSIFVLLERGVIRIALSVQDEQADLRKTDAPLSQQTHVTG